MKKSEFRKFIREAIKSVLKELDGGAPLVAPDGTIQGGPKKKDDEESVNEGKKTIELKTDLNIGGKGIRPFSDTKEITLKKGTKYNVTQQNGSVGTLFQFFDIKTGKQLGSKWIDSLKPYGVYESVNEAKMTSSLKRKLDKEYKDDYELKDHPDKKDKFYALLLKHVPKGNFGHLRKEVGKLFGFTNVQPGSNAGELIEYFRNLVIKGLGIKFRNELVDEDSVEEKVVFYKDNQKRLRRFDTDKGANKKYRT